MNYIITNKAAFEQSMEEIGLIEPELVHSSATIDEFFAKLTAEENKNELTSFLVKKLIEKRLTVSVGQPVDRLSPDIFAQDQIIGRLTGSTNLETPARQFNKRTMSTIVIFFTLWLLSLFLLGYLFTDLFANIFMTVSFGFTILLGVIPLVILGELFPNLFKKKEFVNHMKSMKEVVDELFRLNYTKYCNRNFQLAKEEIFNLFGPFK